MAKTQAASWAVAGEFWKRVVGKHCVRVHQTFMPWFKADFFEAL